MSLRFLKAKPKLTLSKDKKVRSAPNIKESKNNDETSQIQQSKLGGNIWEATKSSCDDEQKQKENCNVQEEKQGCESISKQKVSEGENNFQSGNKEIKNQIESEAPKKQENIVSDYLKCLDDTQKKIDSKAFQVTDTTSKSLESKVRDDVDNLEYSTKKHSSLTTNLGRHFPSEETSDILQHALDSNEKKPFCTSIVEKSLEPHKKTQTEVPGVTNENIRDEKFKDKQSLNSSRERDVMSHTDDSLRVLSSQANKEPANTKKIPLPQKPAPERILSPKESPEKLESGFKKDSTNKTKSLSSYIKQLEEEKQQLISNNLKSETSAAKVRSMHYEKSPNSKKDTIVLKPNSVKPIEKGKRKDPPASNKKSPKKNIESKEIPTLNESSHKQIKTLPSIENKYDVAIDKSKKEENKSLKRKNVNVTENKVNNEDLMSLKDTICIDKKPKTSLKTYACKSKDAKKTSLIKNSNTITHKSHSVSPILTKENIESLPMIIIEPSSSNGKEKISADDKIVFLLPEDHIYAKSNVCNIPSVVLNTKSNETENSTSIFEKSIASVKMKNLSNDEKKQLKLKHLNPLNAFQRALLLENASQDEDQMSEASECDNRLIVDVNACTYNEQDDFEEAPINEISYSFNDRDLKEFSGLSLVTKFIKAENEDPPQQMDCIPLFMPDHEIRPLKQDNHCEEEVIYSDNVVQIFDSNSSDLQREKLPEVLHASVNDQFRNEQKPNTIENSPRKKYTSFHIKRENNPHIEIKKEIIDLSSNTKNQKIKSEIDLGNATFKIDNYSKVDTDSKTQKYPVDNYSNITSNSETKAYTEKEGNSDLKRIIKVKKDDDYEYMPDEEAYDSSSDLDIDVDEREFVIYGKAVTGLKKKISESVYHKRQMETMKKIKTQTAWKENLTVCDLIFYNPESNPMTNPPDIAVVKKNEVVLDSEKQLSEDEEAVDNPEPVPQLKISADGKLIIDPKSLIIEETGLKKSKERLQQSEALIESKHTIKKFDNLYSKNKIKRKVCEWAPEDTIMFYRALNTIGTDFSMMASLFGNRTRNEIKRKYKLEERKNPSLLAKALTNYNKFDIDELKSEINADKRRAERIKKEERDRQELLREEKRRQKMVRPRGNYKRVSVCGKLIPDSAGPKKKIPEYVRPPIELFQNDIKACS